MNNKSTSWAVRLITLVIGPYVSLGSVWATGQETRVSKLYMHSLNSGPMIVEPDIEHEKKSLRIANFLDGGIELRIDPVINTSQLMALASIRGVLKDPAEDLFAKNSAIRQPTSNSHILSSAQQKTAQPEASNTQPKAVSQVDVTKSCGQGEMPHNVISAHDTLERAHGKKARVEIGERPEPIGYWEIDPREGTLSQVLAKWAKGARWQLSWEADRDFVIDTHVAMNGTLRQAVELVMMSLSHTDYPLQAAMNSSTCTMRVIRLMDIQPK